MTRKGIQRTAHNWIESFGMKLIARAIMPVFISLVGFLIADTLQNINQSIKEVKTEVSTASAGLWQAQRATATALSVITGRLEVLYERVDQDKKWLDEADKRQSNSIESLNKRLDEMTKIKPH